MDNRFLQHSCTIFCMVSITMSGKSPTEVSPLSITASAPSRTEFATSLTSARVGRGEVIMLSSICVATITGFEAALHFFAIIFCNIGTCSIGISTPKITTGNHNTISYFNNLINIINCFWFFNFGNYSCCFTTPGNNSF